MASPRSLEGVLVKKPHVSVSMTSSEIQDFAKCADQKLGPQYFMDHFFYIQHPTQGQMLYHPYDYQKGLIDSYHNYRYSISLMPRQTGKTTSAAGYLLWYAMFVPDSTILVAAHKYTGAQEIMQRIRYAYENCPDYIRAGVTSYNKGSIEFENGSRIVAQTTTETTGRGMAITLLYSDEFAYVRPNIAKEFWTSVAPTLATGGKCIITSTPNSDEDQFAILWKQANKCIDEYGNETEIGINGFKAFRSYWRDHPDRDEEWGKEQLSQLGEDRFRREMDCEFIIDDETLISASKLLDLEGEEPLFKHGQVRWFKKPQKDKIYVVALDPSLGTGGDPAAIQIFEANSTEQVGEWRHNKTPIQQQIQLLVNICKYIADETSDRYKIYYTVENNTLGEAALVSIAEYGEENIQGVFMTETKAIGGKRQRRGFNTTHKSKIAACAKLKSLIETGRMKIKSKNLISELKTFIALGNSFEAKSGETDDLVMSTILIVRVLQELQTYDANLSSHMRDYNDNVIEPLPFIVF